MPLKELFSPFKNGVLKDFKFGGGANTIVAFEDPDNSGIGYQLINAGGGNDTVTGSPNDDTIIGGTGSDDIAGGLGNDTIYGGRMDGTDAPKGHNAVLINNLTGDDESVVFDGGTYTGGNDTIFGGDGGTNNIYGDVRFTVVFSANDSFTGGDDTLTGGDSTADDMAFNNIFGDARFVSFTAGDGANGESFTGGDDTLTGGSGASNLLLGDVQSISNDGDFTGGDDTLIGGANGTNTMIGDVSSGSNAGTTTGGDDRLVGGANADDLMTGDFGAAFVEDTGEAGGTLVGGLDTFVIGVGSGADTILDFHVVEFTDIDNVDFGDTIELVDFGFTDFSNLSGMWSVNGSGFAVLDLDGTNDGAGDIVTFNGITDFSDLADSFDFT